MTRACLPYSAASFGALIWALAIGGCHPPNESSVDDEPQAGTTAAQGGQGGGGQNGGQGGAGQGGFTRSCEVANGGCSPLAECSMVDDEVHCECPEGTEGDGRDCQDVDECRNGDATCDDDPRATCVNQPGSYTCFCPANTLDQDLSNPGRDCMPNTFMGGMGGMTGGMGGMTGGMGGMTGGSGAVDECALDTDSCDDEPDACMDTAAGFTCVCPEGYDDTIGDGTQCDLVDPDPCPDNDCEDVDECLMNTDDCDTSPVATCINIPDGLYTCTCPMGYQDPAGRNCVDIDECALNTDTCDTSPVATCTNMPAGSYTCTCPTGYGDPTGRDCVDLDECALNTDTCDTSPVATCTNMPAGSYTCTCPMGYSDPTGRNCVDVDECAGNTDDCDAMPNACVDIDGGFVCICPDGYADTNGDGSQCDNIDECAMNLDECDTSPLADCMDLVGSFECICPDGYDDTDGDAISDCIDIDECAQGMHDCDTTPLACQNLTPGFTCECPLGYRDVNGDGSDCDPIMIPIDDMEGPPYLGLFERGLYPGGNLPPAAHRAKGLELANELEPLDIDGHPSPSGKIVMMSIGMSNAEEEWCTAYNDSPPRMDGNDPTIPECGGFTLMGRWRYADEPTNKTTLQLVNGAYPGQDAAQWNSDLAGMLFPPVPANAAIPTVDGNYNRIRDHVLPYYMPEVSEAQVQVVWMKNATAGASISLPAANADAYTLEGRFAETLRVMKQRYPNLKMVFLTSRMYAGFAPGFFSSVEPYAYEGGFAVKWLIEAQIDQMASGGTLIDPVAGDLNYENGTAPWIAWGPYLWANGETPRQSDGLSYNFAAEFTPDGTHPTQVNQAKIGLLLMHFFETSPFTSCWFMGAGVCE